MFVVDIDGTLCETDEGINCLGSTHSKDDILRIMDPARIAKLKPRQDVIELVREAANKKIFIAVISGRWDYLMHITKAWLNHHEIPWHSLQLRKNGLWQMSSVEVKLEGYHGVRKIVDDRGFEALTNHGDVWVDDDQNMLDAAEKLGFKTTLVTPDGYRWIENG